MGELLFALVLVVIIGCTWLSWQRQRLLSDLRPTRPSPLASAQSELDQATAPVPFHQIERVGPQSASSVLGWEAFSIASTLLLDGTVLVSCTRRSDNPLTRGRLGHDGSLVLLIGDDEEADRAFHLIEDWRAANTTLRLRPTSRASAIELYDRHDNALRAGLLAT